MVEDIPLIISFPLAHVAIHEKEQKPVMNSLNSLISKKHISLGS